LIVGFYEGKNLKFAGRVGSGFSAKLLRSRNSMATTAYLRVSTGSRSAILLQKPVSKASIAKIVCVSLPPSVALSRQGGYAHTLKGYFYTNLGGP
jgi:hypothetical protein